MKSHEKLGVDVNSEAEAPPRAAKNLAVEIFADGADERSLRALAADPLIKGFTTNPTLMRKAGVADYEQFARMALSIAGSRPISFEVFADDFGEMEAQALEIASWGPNVYVKIPITNTRRDSATPLLRRLAAQRVQVNVTALQRLDQVRDAADAMRTGPKGFVSVFAGRIADTGRDPIPLMREAVRILRPYPQLRLIWASPRELLNIYHAEEAGCHVITVTPEVLAKLALIGKDLGEYSLETVKMFHDDAKAAGYAVRTRQAVSS